MAELNITYPGVSEEDTILSIAFQIFIHHNILSPTEAIDRAEWWYSTVSNYKYKGVNK